MCELPIWAVGFFVGFVGVLWLATLVIVHAVRFAGGLCL